MSDAAEVAAAAASEERHAWRRELKAVAALAWPIVVQSGMVAVDGRICRGTIRIRVRMGRAIRAGILGMES